MNDQSNTQFDVVFRMLSTPSAEECEIIALTQEIVEEVETVQPLLDQLSALSQLQYPDNNSGFYSGT